MKFGKVLTSMMLLSLMIPGMVSAEAIDQEEIAEGIKIGILAFNPDDAETKAYREYLENYLGEAFDAEFYYSEAVNTIEEEKNFIEQLHERNVQGVIGNISEETMALCETYGIYYMYGSATVSDEVFERIKRNAHFLGTISSSLEEEAAVANQMALFFAEDERKDEHGFVICTGGDNEMHRVRSVAMLNALITSYNLNLDKSAEELAETEEVIQLETGTNVKIALVPGYPGVTPLAENVETVLSAGGYDTVLSVLTVNPIKEAVYTAEENTQTDIRIGSIDCFTEEAAEMYQAEDIFGNPQLNYLTGTYGAMIAPSFVAMCNAYAESMDMVRDGEEAFQLYRHYWTATNKEEFEELYDQSISLYDNAYSAVDIMKVLKVYTPEVVFEDFKTFVEGTP